MGVILPTIESVFSPKRIPITTEMYHSLTELLQPEQHIELINGELFSMSPIGSAHADWVNRLNKIFTRNLAEEITVAVQNPVHLDQSSEPEPDIALLAPRELSYREAHPTAADVLLLVEVADSSLEFDRTVKLPLYAQHGIVEVWLIDVVANRLEIFREPVDGDYRLHIKPQLRETITLLQLPQVAIDLQPLFALP